MSEKATQDLGLSFCHSSYSLNELWASQSYLPLVIFFAPKMWLSFPSQGSLLGW